MENELELIKTLQSQTLFAAFKAQLIKDFTDCGCDTAFANNLPQNFNHLIMCIESELIKNEKRSHFNLQQLLYRIDINEQQLNLTIKTNIERAYLTIVSEFIIKRILQKIVLKKYLSGNEN